IQGDSTTFTIGASSNADLQSLTVKAIGAGTTSTLVDESYEKGTHSISGLTLSLTVSKDIAAGALIKLTFEITDENLTTTETRIIKVLAGEGEIITYSTVILGGQTNATYGSSFASINGNVYKWADAMANSDKIDFVYFYGSTNGATIASPKDDQAAVAFGSLEFTDWDTQNDTKFAKVSGVNWSEVTGDGIIVEKAVNLNDTRANQLTVDQIVAFETASTSAHPSKKGLFKVTSISGTTGADRQITIEVKVQI
ncbi:hypothetical protein ACFLSA_07155, partial [Bacteroidota bacterium]